MRKGSSSSHFAEGVDVPANTIQWFTIVPRERCYNLPGINENTVVCALPCTVVQLLLAGSCANKTYNIMGGTQRGERVNDRRRRRNQKGRHISTGSVTLTLRLQWQQQMEQLLCEYHSSRREADGNSIRKSDVAGGKGGGRLGRGKDRQMV